MEQLALWYGRDLSDEQRVKLLALWFGKEAADEARSFELQLKLFRRQLERLSSSRADDHLKKEGVR